MLLFKQVIRKIVRLFGYDLVNVRNQTICSYQNFEAIITAYEYLINDKNAIKIPENNVRAKLMARLRGTHPPEAYSIILGLFETRLLSGDVCEFGVAQGETSALIANEIQKDERKLHLFDSFEGLPAPSEKDTLINDIFSLKSMEAYAGKMKCPEEMVLRRLSAVHFPDSRYVIHKGFIDKVLQSDKRLPAEISFAYIDFDFYEPILDALRFVNSRSQVGCVIIVDDYNYFSSGVKVAVDEFIKNENMQKKRYHIEIPDSTMGYFAILKKVGK